MQNQSDSTPRTGPILHKTISANTKGRDFVVGDIHGCYGLLMEKLDKANFDRSCDRLFSVGDLIDRGPDSLKCLELLDEPWFYAVLGNHEAMFLQYMGVRDNFYSSPRDFLPNGGSWVLRMTAFQMYRAETLAFGAVAELPLRLTVEHPAGNFDVVHAQYVYGYEFIDTQPELDAISIEQACTWGRTVIYAQMKTLSDEQFEQFMQNKPEVLKIEPVMQPQRPLTYVGHTIVRAPTLTRSHFFIDTGAYTSGYASEPGTLTLIEHASQTIY